MPLRWRAAARLRWPDGSLRLPERCETLTPERRSHLSEVHTRLHVCRAYCGGTAHERARRQVHLDVRRAVGERQAVRCFACARWRGNTPRRDLEGLPALHWAASAGSEVRAVGMHGVMGPCASGRAGRTAGDNEQVQIHGCRGSNQQVHPVGSQGAVGGRRSILDRVGRHCRYRYGERMAGASGRPRRRVGSARCRRVQQARAGRRRMGRVLGPDGRKELEKRHLSNV